MSELNAVFGADTAVVTDEVVKKSSDDRKIEVTKMKEAMRETLATTPNFLEKVYTLSNSLEVVNTLGYGNDGNIIVDKNSPDYGKPELDDKGNPILDDKGRAKTKRPLKATSRIEGYTVRNVGTQAISYKTEIWAPNEEGVYVGTIVTKTLNPGETIQLSRKYMTMLCSIPEFSFKLKNGSIVKSSKNTTNVDENLASYYFTFNKDLGIEVNDDEVKLKIGADRVVAPEYIETFGYLCNTPAEKKRERKAGAQQPSIQVMAANYVQKLIASQSM